MGLEEVVSEESSDPLPKRVGTGIGVGLIGIYRFVAYPIYHALSYVGIKVGCKYEPSCSHYTEEAIKEYGLLKGSAMGVHRIMRCNPWSKGGHDPVKKLPGCQVVTD